MTHKMQHHGLNSALNFKTHAGKRPGRPSPAPSVSLPASWPVHEYYIWSKRHPGSESSGRPHLLIPSPQPETAEAPEKQVSHHVSESWSLLLALLVHSTEASVFPRCHNKTLAAAKPSGVTELQTEGEREREREGSSPRLCSLAHLWINVPPPGFSTHPSPRRLPLPSYFLQWPHRFLFGPAHSWHMRPPASQMQPTHTHLHLHTHPLMLSLEMSSSPHQKHTFSSNLFGMLRLMWDFLKWFS